MHNSLYIYISMYLVEMWKLRSILLSLVLALSTILIGVITIETGKSKCCLIQVIFQWKVVLQNVVCAPFRAKITRKSIRPIL